MEFIVALLTYVLISVAFETASFMVNPLHSASFPDYPARNDTDKVILSYPVALSFARMATVMSILVCSFGFERQSLILALLVIADVAREVLFLDFCAGIIGPQHKFCISGAGSVIGTAIFSLVFVLWQVGVL